MIVDRTGNDSGNGEGRVVEAEERRDAGKLRRKREGGGCIRAWVRE